MNIDEITTAQQLFEALSRSTDDYIYMSDVQKNIFYFPQEMVDEFELPSTVIENAAVVWGAKIHLKDQSAFFQEFQSMIDGKKNTHCVEYRALNREGKWVWLRCRGYMEHNSRGEATIFAGTITDIGKRGKIDPITSLLNRYEFENQIKFHLESKEATGGILFLGIDDFSNINGLYGREFGDAVLRNTSKILIKTLSEEIRIYRLDGDKFALFSAEITAEGWQENYENIFSVFQKQQELLGEKYYCTLSAGCEVFDSNPITFDDAYKHAETALEKAKALGKNQFCMFKPELIETKLRALEIIETMRRDAENNFANFEVYYQPLVNASDARVIGAEALLRWHCEKYGAVSPVEFIPLLEASGLIHSVGRFVLQQAVDICCKWKKGLPDFCMNINISYQQLLRRDFVLALKAILEPLGGDASSIKLELTESCIVSGSRYLTESFADLRALGVEIAMDDFGTGYSSLEILKNAPADIVKIDRAFVKDILTSEFDLTFIRFIVALCHNVNISVCLEGIETSAEYDAVKPLNLDILQGFLFDHPVPATDFEKKFLQGR